MKHIMNRTIHDVFDPRPEMHIALISDRLASLETLSQALGQVCPVRLLPPAINPLLIDESTLCIVLDADLSNDQTVNELGPLRKMVTEKELPCLFIIDDALDEISLVMNLNRAKEFGVANYISRQPDADEVLQVFSSVIDIKEGAQNIQAIIEISKTHKTLSDLLDAILEKRENAFQLITESDELILDALTSWGIKPWIDTVRRHHDATYRHSLSVTGFAVMLCQALKTSQKDQRRVARAALLHDIGKAFIPVSILDKPGKLTDTEMTEIRKHPALGHQLLIQCGGFSDEVLDCVLHHHEMLDGSGYPDRLKGSEIADLVRIVTIADIFSALIERRAYRKPLPPEEALQIMKQMGDKLDPDLMRLFETVVAEFA